MSLCAPNVDIELHFTCFTKDELISIVKAFNNYIINKNLCKDKTGSGLYKIGCIKRLSLITIPQPFEQENESVMEDERIKK